MFLGFFCNLYVVYLVISCQFILFAYFSSLEVASMTFFATFYYFYLGLIAFFNVLRCKRVFLCRVFTGARIAHSVVYIWSVPQPARALAFFTGKF